MKHPMLADWIRFERASRDEYIVRDLLLDKQMYATADAVQFARQLDGKRDPYSIDPTKTKEQTDELLAVLEKHNIIRDRRFVTKSLFYSLITLCRIRTTKRLRLISRILNTLLVSSWLPLLCASVVYFYRYMPDFDTMLFLPGVFFGLLVGVVMHELGHMFACLAYGGIAFEIGVLFQFFMPGAYVLMNEANVKNRMHRVQIYAAGVEMNFLLTACSLFLSAATGDAGGFFFGSALQNILLALLNLTFLGGMDGFRIITELLGLDDCLLERAKLVTASRHRRKCLRREGLSGNATIAVCYAFRGIQIAMPVLVILNIAGVFVWFQ